MDPRDPHSLPLSLVFRIDRLCSDFESDWAAGRHPQIEAVLDQAPEPDRPVLLRELIALEVELRRESGETPTPHDYRTRFAQLAPDLDELLTSTAGPKHDPRDSSTAPTDPDPTSTTIRSVTLPAHDDPTWRESPVDDSEATDRSAGSRGRFRILNPYARGGLGEVSIALDRELRREVALKEIQARFADNPESRRRFVLEAEITGGLEHPGIVPIYALGRYRNGRPFYAMRFVRGRSLREAIDTWHASRTVPDTSNKQDRNQNQAPSNSPDEPIEFDLRALIRRFQDVCQSVAYAHSRSVVHRDIKPSNILLGPFGETLLVDWGLAKLLGDERGAPNGSTSTNPNDTQHDGDGSGQTASGAIVGTPAYMSPEQADPNAHPDAEPQAVDIFCLGATLYHILTGQAPYTGPRVNDVITKAAAARFDNPRQIQADIPRPLEAICLKAMAWRPEDRYASALALHDDLEAWLADEPVSAYPDFWPVRLARWGRRHRTVVGIATAALILISLGLTTIVAIQGRANDRINQALRAEQRARTFADGQSELALQAIGTYSDEVSQTLLLEEPEFTDLRTRLLEGPRQFYSELALALQEAGVEDEPERQQKLAEALTSQALLTRQIGDPSKARDLFRQALDNYRQLVDQDNNSYEISAGLAETLDQIGVLTRELEGMDASKEATQEALAIRRRLVEDDPQSVEGRLGLTKSLLLEARRLSETEAVEEALDRYREAVQIRRALQTEQPENRERIRGLADAIRQYSNHLGSMGQLVEARQALKEAIGVFDNLPDEADLDERYPLALLLFSQGITALRSGQSDQALGALERCGKVLAQLIEERPNVLAYPRLANQAEIQLGNVLSNLDRFDEAAQAQRRAIEQMSRMRALAPENRNVQLALANSQYNYGATLDRAGDPAAALKPLQEAEALVGDLLRDEPQNSQRAFQHLMTLGALSTIHNKIGQFAQAQGIAERALAKAPPANSPLRQIPEVLDVIDDAYVELALARRRQGQPIEAVEVARQRLAFWRDSKAEPRRLGIAADLAACLGLFSKTPDGLEARDRCLDEAIDLIDQQIALGQPFRAALRQDERFNVLRGSESIRQRFDRGFPRDPFVTETDGPDASSR